MKEITNEQEALLFFEQELAEDCPCEEACLFCASARYAVNAIKENERLRAELERQTARAKRAEEAISLMAQSISWPEVCTYCKTYSGEESIDCKDNCFFIWNGKEGDK